MATVVFNDEFTISTKDTKIFVDITSGENFVWIPAMIQLSSITGNPNLFTIGTGDITLQLDFTKSLQPDPTGITRTPYIEAVAELIDSTLIAGTFDILVRGGKLQKWSVDSIVAHNDNLSTVETTIGDGMPVNGINIITFPSTSGIMAISSTSTDDVGVTGIGLQLVVIEYLDTSFDTFFEVISLNGTTKVTTIASMFKIQKIIGLVAGSAGSNQGTLYMGFDSDTFTGGAPDTEVFHTMGIFSNFSSTSTFTVTGDTNYSITIDGSTNTNQSKPVLVTLYVQLPGRLRVIAKRDYFTGNSLNYNAIGAPTTPKGSNIELTAVTTSGTAAAHLIISFYAEDD